MDRIIKLADIRSAVDEAYEKFKNDNEGEVDSRLNVPDSKKFGISVMLTDGTIINKGDTDTSFPIGSIGKIPVAEVLLSQADNVIDVIEKSGCCCKCSGTKKSKPAIPLSARGIRALSAIQPTGDSDGKWSMLINSMIDLMGSSPELDDNLYKSLSVANKDADIENVLAQNEFYLFDDAPIAIDLYTRLMSMKATTEQLAIMGTTIAADGYNPMTKQNVFDGTLSQRIVAMMAAKGPHHMSLPWLVKSGLPAKSSFGGGMLGVMPGVMAISAYSPLLNEAGISIKSAKSIVYIMNKLGINVFGSAKIKIEK